MKLATTLFLSLLLLPLAAYAQQNEPGLEEISVKDTTLLEVREAAIIKARELQELLVVYEGTPQEISSFKTEIRHLVEMDGRYFKNSFKVENKQAWQLRMAIRMVNRLNYLNDTLKNRFEETRKKYCEYSYQVEEEDGQEVGKEIYYGKRIVNNTTPADKAALFCVVAIPSNLPRF